MLFFQVSSSIKFSTAFNMSLITKCFLVVFAALCCLQLAEMARLPRSDAPAPTPTLEDFSKQLTDIFQNLANAVQKLPEDERVKGITDGLESTLKEGLKKMSEAFPREAKQN